MTQKNRYRKIKVFFKYLRRGIYLSIAVVLLIFVWVMWQVEQAAKVSSNQNADAAIILGAAAWGKKPSPVFRERIRHAIDLYQQKRVSVLIFTGGTPKEGYETEAQVGKAYAMSQGIPERDIIIEEKSRDTSENFAFTKTEIQNSSLNTFLIVSDPYHMYRSMMIAKDNGYIAYPSPTPYSRFNEPKGQFKFLFNETVSSLVYKIGRLFSASSKA